MDKEQLIQALKKTKPDVIDISLIKVYKTGDIKIRYKTSQDKYTYMTIAKYSGLKLTDEDLRELKKEVTVKRE